MLLKKFTLIVCLVFPAERTYEFSAWGISLGCGIFIYLIFSSNSLSPMVILVNLIIFYQKQSIYSSVYFSPFKPLHGKSDSNLESQHF